MTDFKLIHMKITNFACYYGENELDLTSKKKGNVFLFRVLNGYGKTSLFQAIKWGFYGEDIEYYKDSKKVTMDELLNQNVNRRTGSFSVEIQFKYGKSNYTLIRKYTPNSSEQSTVQLHKDGGLVSEDSAKDELDRIMPRDYADFFMFDGELLSRFMSAQAELNSIESIHRLLGLRQVKILVEDLDSLSRKYEKELGELQGISTEVAHFAKGLRKVREEIDEYERTISGLQLEIQTFKNDKEKLEAHRDRYKDIPEVTKKIQDLNEKRQSINSKVTKSKTLLDDHADSLFGVFLTKDLQKLIESNEKRIARLETASGLKKEDIEKLETREQILKRSIPTCDICGHTLTKEEVIELKKNTKAVKDKIESMSKYKKEINGLAYQNRVYKAFMKDYPFDFVAQLDEFYENVEKLRDANKEYDNLSEKMQGKEYGDFGKLNSEISELDKKIGRKEDEIDEKGEKKKEKENERDEIVRSIKCTGHDDKTLNTTAGLTDLSRRLRNNLGMILTSGTRLKRGKILEEANRIFKEITNKPDEHKGLEFEDDDSYSFVIRKYDGEIVKNPSKGEKQVLAISFLLGLNQYTGINNIILMDTPVASLDPIHSARVGNALSKLDNQVIFLAQPTELSGDMYKNMKTGIAKEFEIERKEIKKGSYASFFKEV